MIRTLLLCVFMAITIPFPIAVGQDSKTTTWKGTLDALGTELRLELNIDQKENDFTGEIRSPDQENSKMDLAEIELDKKSLSFAIPQIDAKFLGQLEEKGTVAKGKFTQGGWTCR